MITNLIYKGEVIKTSFVHEIPQAYGEIVCGGVRYKIDRITYNYDEDEVNVELLKCRE